MTKKTITGWSIAVTWSDGTKENITDIDNETAKAVDTYLTEIEEHEDLAKHRISQRASLSSDLLDS